MKGMASLMSLNTSQERHAGQSKVANQIERLVAAKLVGKAQGAVHNAVLSQHDGVFERTTTDKAHFSQRRYIALKTERPRAGQQMSEGLRADSDFHFLLSHQRMPEVDVAANAKFTRRVDANPPVALNNLERPQDPEVASLASQPTNAAIIQQSDERLR